MLYPVTDKCFNICISKEALLYNTTSYIHVQNMMKMHTLCSIYLNYVCFQLVNTFGDIINLLIQLRNMTRRALEQHVSVFYMAPGTVYKAN